MVRAGADPRQAEGQVGCLGEVHRLQRPESLVVEHRHDAIELPREMAGEGGVSGMGTRGLDARLAQGIDGWPDDTCVLDAE